MLGVLIVSSLTGDPLYVAGGQPKSSRSEHVDESFAEDGYEIFNLFAPKLRLACALS